MLPGLLALAWLGAAHAEVVDRVLLVIEDQVILASDVRIEEDLARLDVSPWPIWDPARADARQRLVDAAVVRELAGDVLVFQPDEAAVDARFDALRARFDGEAAWIARLAAWGVDEKELRGLIRRRLVVERYLARSIQVPPTDRERFLAAVDALLGAARPRMRIREVEPRGAAP